MRCWTSTNNFVCLWNIVNEFASYMQSTQLLTKPQIQRKVISNVFKYFKKSDQPIFFLLHQILLDFYPQCLREPRSKYGNMFSTCLKTQGSRTQRKTLNKHLKSGNGYWEWLFYLHQQTLVLWYIQNSIIFQCKKVHIALF